MSPLKHQIAMFNKCEVISLSIKWEENMHTDG